MGAQAVAAVATAEVGAEGGMSMVVVVVVAAVVAVVVVVVVVAVAAVVVLLLLLLRAVLLRLLELGLAFQRESRSAVPTRYFVKTTFCTVLAYGPDTLIFQIFVTLPISPSSK